MRPCPRRGGAELACKGAWGRLGARARRDLFAIGKSKKRGFFIYHVSETKDSESDFHCIFIVNKKIAHIDFFIFTKTSRPHLFKYFSPMAPTRICCHLLLGATIPGGTGWRTSAGADGVAHLPARSAAPPASMMLPCVLARIGFIPSGLILAWSIRLRRAAPGTAGGRLGQRCGPLPSCAPPPEARGRRARPLALPLPPSWRQPWRAHYAMSAAAKPWAAATGRGGAKPARPRRRNSWRPIYLREGNYIGVRYTCVRRIQAVGISAAL